MKQSMILSITIFLSSTMAFSSDLLVCGKLSINRTPTENALFNSATIGKINVSTFIENISERLIQLEQRHVCAKGSVINHRMMLSSVVALNEQTTMLCGPLVKKDIQENGQYDSVYQIGGVTVFASTPAVRTDMNSLAGGLVCSWGTESNNGLTIQAITLQ